MTVKLLHDRVLLKPIEADEKSSGGIVLARAAEPKYEAEVLAVGKGFRTEEGQVLPMSVAVGDVVLYNPQPVQRVKLDGQDLLVIKEEDIYAVL